MKQGNFDGHGFGEAAGGSHFAANAREGDSQAESPDEAGWFEREPRGELNADVRSTGLVGDEMVCGSPCRQTTSGAHVRE